MSSCNTVIDWAATGSMLSGIGTIAGVIAVIVAAVLGKQSFDQWRSQRVAERKIEVAERIQTIVYRTEDAIERIRFPISTGLENSLALSSLESTGVVNDQTIVELRSRLIIPQITVNRMNQYVNLWEELSDLIPISRTLFEPVVAEQIALLREQRNLIAGAASGLANIAHERVRPHGQQRNDAMDIRQQRYESIIWDGDLDGDAMKEIIKSVIKKIEDHFAPLFREDRAR